MKKLLFFLILLGLFSCTGNSFIREIERECKVKTDVETLGDGTKYYDYYLFGVNDIVVEQKAKGIIDRRLNQVGRQTDRNDYDRVFRTITNRYEWDTPTEKVTMSLIRNEKSDAHLKIWVQNK